MLQSSYVVALLVVGFLIYITAKGELQAYMGILFPPYGPGQSFQNL